MFSRINRIQKTIMGGAMVVALFSILSKFLGLFRDRLLSSTFGAGKILDAYYAAFRLPDLVFNTLVLGALSSAFIPVFLNYWKKNKDEAWKITSGVLNVLLLIIIFLAVILFFLAPVLVNYLVPGFDGPTKELTVSLTRIMLLGTIFFTLSNIAGSVLNSFQRFFAYSLAPILYNLGIIFGIVFLVKWLGYQGLAWGVVLGSLLHFLVQVPALIKSGYHWRPVFDFRHPAIKKISTLMLPRCFGLAISQFNFIVITFIASTLTIGAVAIYNLSFNLINFPVSIFGISLAISIFPVLSHYFAVNNQKLFVFNFSKTIRRIFYLVLPATVLLFALRAQIVRLVLGAGLFTWRDTILTSQALGWFSISLFAQSLIPIFARAFYATHNTKTPVKIAVVGFIVNVIGCFVLGNLMGVEGLALAFSISSIVNFVLLYLYFNKKVYPLPHQEIFSSIFKIFLLSLLMAGFIQGIKYFVGPLVNMQTFAGVLIQTLAVGIGGFLFYFLATLSFGFSEVKVITEMAFRKIHNPRVLHFFKKWFKI